MKINHESRHMFLAIGLCMAIISPLLLFFVPQLTAELVHHTSEMWHVFVPTENYIMFGVGFLLLIIASMILFLLNIRKVSIILSTTCICLSIVPFYLASQSYKIITEDKFSYSAPYSLEVTEYSWEEVEAITYHEADEGDFSEYEILFSDGNSMILIEDNYFQDFAFRFDHKLEIMNLEVERSL